MITIKELSVFFPAFNEESNIRVTVEKALEVLPSVAETYEIIIVDDGSTDNTKEIADQIAAQNPLVRVIHHKTNLGYGAALRAGFYNAQYDPIVFTDADGQFDFAEVVKFIDLQTQADMVIGYRIKRMDPPMRLLNAWGWKQLIRVFLRLKVRDVDCAFKLVKQDVIKGIPRLNSTRGGTISPELLVKAVRCGYTFIEVGVNHYSRKGGSPTGASPKVIITSFIELMKLWWKIRGIGYYPKQVVHSDQK